MMKKVTDTRDREIKEKENVKDLTKKIEELKNECKEKEAKIKNLVDTLQRLQAEFENYKKRIEMDIIKYKKYAKEELIIKLLNVLDSFELALKNTADVEKFIKGVELIFAQFYSILEKEGLKPIDAVGKKFDPYKHEVLMKEKSDKEDIVIEEFQKGYMLHDKVIRHSKVKIGIK